MPVLRQATAKAAITISITNSFIIIYFPFPVSAKDLGVANRFGLFANITGAAHYLRQILDKFGKLRLAVVAYFAGPGTVRKFAQIPLNGETPAYARNVLDWWVQIDFGMRIPLTGKRKNIKRGPLLITANGDVWVLA